MIPITHWLDLELEVELQPDEEAYIRMRGYVANCLLTLDMDTGGAAKIQATIASGVLFSDEAAVHDDFPWEDIKIAGVVYSEVTFNIASLSFSSPSVLYIKNTSAAGQVVRVYLRGNR